MTNKITLHFENTSAMCIYMWEMSGQISDGKYENSRPYDHWHWLWDVSNLVVDGTAGFEGNSIYRYTNWNNTAFTKRYNLNEWFSCYICQWRRKGNDENIWATRIIAYGKFGKIYPNLTYEELEDLGEVRLFLESLQVLVERGETNPETLFNKITDFSKYGWRAEYYEKCKDVITLNFVKEFVELNYDIKECKADTKSMENTLNTIYGVKKSEMIDEILGAIA